MQKLFLVIEREGDGPVNEKETAIDTALLFQLYSILSPNFHGFHTRKKLKLFIIELDSADPSK